jgi:hypothetical protein
VIRYAGLYSGPSYGTYDPRDGFEGFTSLQQAEDRYRERQETSGASRLDSLKLHVNADYEITGTEAESTFWPATTAEDTLELYHVCRDGETERVSADPFCRLTAGPRGRIKRENY